MKKIIRHGIAWFSILLMNIGLALGTLGLISFITLTPPLTSTPVLIPLGLLYVFFYVLLVIGVLAIDVSVKQKGISNYIQEMMEDFNA